MLTYTFSKREKVLIAIIAVILLALAWYKLVFENVQNRISTLDSQIADVQNELTTSQAQATSLAKMQKVVDEYKSKGYEAVLLPNYNNAQSLMAYLNGVLGSARGYSMQFEDPQMGENDAYVHRVGTISFDTNTYAEARSITQAIARGPYPCQVEALGITDSTALKATSSTEAPVTTSIKVTFMERPTKGMSLSSDDGTSEGQDLSQMSKWNE